LIRASQRVDAAVFEDPPDRGCSDAVTDAAEFARDSSIAPGGFVGGHLDDESADLAGCGWTTGSSGGLGPVAGDSLPVPAQQGVGGDEPSGASRPRERVGDCAEQSPIAVIELWSIFLSAQHRELVA
jgi:hypothetical protein